MICVHASRELARNCTVEESQSLLSEEVVLLDKQKDDDAACGVHPWTS